MARKSNDTLILVLVTVGLFALSCAMRFFLADFQKGIGVLPDEIRYLDLASSLFNDGHLEQARTERDAVLRGLSERAAGTRVPQRHRAKGGPGARASPNSRLHIA